MGGVATLKGFQNLESKSVRWIDSRGIWGKQWYGQYHSDRSVSDTPCSCYRWCAGGYCSPSCMCCRCLSFFCLCAENSVTARRAWIRAWTRKYFSCLITMNKHVHMRMRKCAHAHTHTHIHIHTHTLLLLLCTTATKWPRRSQKRETTARKKKQGE